MKLEARLFLYGVLFFVPVALIYGAWSHGEPVGTAGILLVGGLALMIGGYLWVIAKRTGVRPEDDPDAEIVDGAGDQGVFSPWSWWPVVCAGGAAVAFLALAVGWWLLVLALPIGFIGLIGWVYEFSRGQHAH